MLCATGRGCQRLPTRQRLWGVVAANSFSSTCFALHQRTLSLRRYHEGCVNITAARCVTAPAAAAASCIEPTLSTSGAQMHCDVWRTTAAASGSNVWRRRRGREGREGVLLLQQRWWDADHIFEEQQRRQQRQHHVQQTHQQGQHMEWRRQLKQQRQRTRCINGLLSGPAAATSAGSTCGSKRVLFLWGRMRHLESFSMGRIKAELQPQQQQRGWREANMPDEKLQYSYTGAPAQQRKASAARRLAQRPDFRPYTFLSVSDLLSRAAVGASTYSGGVTASWRGAAAAFLFHPPLAAASQHMRIPARAAVGGAAQRFFISCSGAAGAANEGITHSSAAGMYGVSSQQSPQQRSKQSRASTEKVRDECTVEDSWTGSLCFERNSGSNSPAKECASLSVGKSTNSNDNSKNTTSDKASSITTSCSSLHIGSTAGRIPHVANKCGNSDTVSGSFDISSSSVSRSSDTSSSNVRSSINSSDVRSSDISNSDISSSNVSSSRRNIGNSNVGSSNSDISNSNVSSSNRDISNSNVNSSDSDSTSNVSSSRSNTLNSSHVSRSSDMDSSSVNSSSSSSSNGLRKSNVSSSSAIGNSSRDSSSDSEGNISAENQVLQADGRREQEKNIEERWRLRHVLFATVGGCLFAAYMYLLIQCDFNVAKTEWLTGEKLRGLLLQHARDRRREALDRTKYQVGLPDALQKELATYFLQLDLDKPNGVRRSDALSLAQEDVKRRSGTTLQEFAEFFERLLQELELPLVSATVTVPSNKPADATFVTEQPAPLDVEEKRAASVNPDVSVGLAAGFVKNMAAAEIPNFDRDNNLAAKPLDNGAVTGDLEAEELAGGQSAVLGRAAGIDNTTSSPQPSEVNTVVGISSSQNAEGASHDPLHQRGEKPTVTNESPPRAEMEQRMLKFFGDSNRTTVMPGTIPPCYAEDTSSTLLGSIGGSGLSSSSDLVLQQQQRQHPQLQSPQLSEDTVAALSFEEEEKQVLLLDIQRTERFLSDYRTIQKRRELSEAEMLRLKDLQHTLQRLKHEMWSLEQKH